MLLYEDIDGNVYFYVEAATPFIATPMNMKPALSKHVSNDDLRWLLEKYHFIETELQWYGKPEEKPKSKAYIHKSLDETVRVLLTENSPDKERMLARVLEQISRITFKYNSMYTPINVIQLVQMVLERKLDAEKENEPHETESVGVS